MKKLLFLAIIFGIVSCTENEQPSVVDDAGKQDDHFHLSTEQMRLAGIEFGQPLRTLIYDRIRCSGNIDLPPQNRASISASMSARVTEVRFYPGDKVERGEVLCKMKDQHFIQMQEEFLNAIEEERYIQVEFERKKKLMESSAIAEKELLKIENQRKKIQIKREALFEKLSWLGFDPDQIQDEGIQKELMIRSPLTGYITEMNLNIGKEVKESELLYEVVDPSHMHLELQVYQSDLSLIKKGQPIVFSFPKDSNEYEGEVFLVGQKVDDDTRKVRVHGHFEKDYANMKPGALFQAEILVEGDTAWALPEEAFVKDDEGWIIFLREGDGVKGISVERGRQDGNRVELKALPESLTTREFVVKGTYYLDQPSEAGHSH